MGTGSALTHLGLGRSMGLFFLVVDLLGKPQFPGVPPFMFLTDVFLFLLTVFLDTHSLRLHFGLLNVYVLLL